MVGAIEMSGDRFLNIIVLYRVKMFGKPSRETLCSFTEEQITTNTTRDAQNHVCGSVKKTRLDNYIESQK